MGELGNREEGRGKRGRNGTQDKSSNAHADVITLHKGRVIVVRE